MVSLGDVKRSATTLFAQGQHVPALRLYDAIVAAAPLDFESRIRLADCALALGDPRAFVVREGEAGSSFFFVAGGTLRVYATDGLGRQTDLAQLGENAVFGEMSLLSAQPRSATVACQTEVDLFEVGRQSLSSLADEL